MGTFEESYKKIRDDEKDYTGEVLVDHFGNHWEVTAQTYLDIDGIAMPVHLKDGGTIWMMLEPGKKK